MLLDIFMVIMLKFRSNKKFRDACNVQRAGAYKLSQSLDKLITTTMTQFKAAKILKNPFVQGKYKIDKT